MIPEPDFTIGIEEEYLLIDPASRNLIQTFPEGMLECCEKALPGQVSPEFLQCQIEVGTRVCNSVKDARADLAHLRKSLIDIAEQFGLQMLAASTHPFAQSVEQRHTRQQRYEMLAEDLQAVVHRLVICGMHVHVGIGDDELRIDLMNQASYTLPHLLALSTSSPFWEGHDTGLKSYRIAVWDELPRTGLPEQFTSYTEYRRHVDLLIKAGIIEDGTKLWWDIRPSERYPTLEMRIPDICTRLDDGICIAAIYQCWLRMLYRLRRNNQRWRQYSNMLIDENRWRAHRYGIDEGLVDFGHARIVPYQDLFMEMLELIHEDAQALDCVDELQHGLKILQQGTSAHRQRKIYYQQLQQGATNEQALTAVVDMLVTETRLGL